MRTITNRLCTVQRPNRGCRSKFQCRSQIQANIVDNAVANESFYCLFAETYNIVSNKSCTNFKPAYAKRNSFGAPIKVTWIAFTIVTTKSPSCTAMLLIGPASNILPSANAPLIAYANYQFSSKTRLHARKGCNGTQYQWCSSYESWWCPAVRSLVVSLDSVCDNAACCSILLYCSTFSRWRRCTTSTTALRRTSQTSFSTLTSFGRAKGISLGHISLNSGGTEWPHLIDWVGSCPRRKHILTNVNFK